MKKLLIFILLFWVSAANAATFTAVWCPVKGAYWYDICVETTVPTGGQCSGAYYQSAFQTTSYIFTIPNSANVWLRVRAENFIIDWTARSIITVYGAYSNPVQVIGNLAPPIVSCGCP